MKNFFVASVFRPFAAFSPLVLAVFVSSCDSESKSPEEKSESKTEETPIANPASDLNSINGILTSEGEYVWALNQLILDMKTSEDAEAAAPKLQEMKSLASKIAEARRKFPALKNEKALLQEHSKPIMRLTIGRQSLGFTLRAKENHVQPVYEVIQPTLDELLAILPAPNQPSNGQ